MVKRPQPYRVGFIGSGGRSCAYARHYVADGEVEVSCIADPLPANRTMMKKRCGLGDGCEEFADWQEMLARRDDLQGLIITSPNHAHVDQAVAALQRDIPVALEKPLATTKDACERVLETMRARRGRLLVGFVMRSTPFYAKIHELIRAGAIGRVLNIQADELVGTTVTSLMMRSDWRRYEQTSGGILLEKCCHDIDLINWMADSRPVAVASFGNRTIFTPNPSLPETCDGCPAASSCLYYKSPKRASYEDEGESVLNQFVNQADACIYNIDKSVMDNQSVTIQYENGMLANFMLTLNCSGERAGRNFHAIGTRGRVWGNFHDNVVYHYDNASSQLETYKLQTDGSGHGGGDRTHVMQLKRMMVDPQHQPSPGAEAGYLSAALCFAADFSRKQHRMVSLTYCDNGTLDMH